MDKNSEKNKQGDRHQIDPPRSQDAEATCSEAPRSESQQKHADARVPPRPQKSVTTFVGLRLPKRKKLVTASIVVTAIATAIYAGVTVYQLATLTASIEISERAAKAAESAATTGVTSLKLAQQNVRLEQRAWVAPGTVKPGDLKPDERPYFAIQISNPGRQPAHVSNSEVGFTTLDRDTVFDPAKHLDYPSIDPTAFVIFPGGDFLTDGMGRTALDKATLAALRSGAKRLYFYGRAEYRDDFGEHRTTWCYVLETDLKRLHTCAVYNDAS